MQALRLGNLAERVIILQADSAGKVTPVTVYKKKKKKKDKNDWMKRPGTTAMDQVRNMGNTAFKVLDRGRKQLGQGGMFPMM
jgi:uncharacterized Fe-S cluster-containing radical SAM superfamily enzyme